MVRFRRLNVLTFYLHLLYKTYSHHKTVPPLNDGLIYLVRKIPAAELVPRLEIKKYFVGQEYALQGFARLDQAVAAYLLLYSSFRCRAFNLTAGAFDTSA